MRMIRFGGEEVYLVSVAVNRGGQGTVEEMPRTVLKRVGPVPDAAGSTAQGRCMLPAAGEIRNVAETLPPAAGCSFSTHGAIHARHGRIPDRNIGENTFLARPSMLLWESNRRSCMAEKTDVWQGTLALMVLKTLEAMGPQHGYGIARRIEQTSGDLLSLNYGTLYPALLKLEQEGYICSEWGVSDNNRKAKFYKLTRAGQKQLAKEARQWEQATEIMARFMTPKEI